MQTSDVLTETVRIVSAHVGNNNVPSEALPDLIKSVYGALTGLDEAVAAERKAKESPTPSVKLDRSVFPSYMVCLDCGKEVTMIKRHLMTEHQMTPSDYRTKWGLPANYPMVAPAYAVRRSELAKESGLGKRKFASVSVMRRGPGRPRKQVAAE